MNILPYHSVGRLRFNDSRREDCISSFGTPNKTRLNGEEFLYDNFIVRFVSETELFDEITFLPKATIEIAGIEATWDKAFMRRLCLVDKAPLDIHGFIVFLKFGITVTGIHDDDESQLAITAFSKGSLDPLLKKGKPFDSRSIH